METAEVVAKIPGAYDQHTDDKYFSIGTRYTTKIITRRVPSRGYV